MKVPNWKASGRLQEKGRKRHRRRQQKAKAFKALVKKLQAPRQLPGSFLVKENLQILQSQWERTRQRSDQWKCFPNAI